jgi:SAM-dependent methyltransferase
MSGIDLVCAECHADVARAEDGLTCTRGHTFAVDGQGYLVFTDLKVATTTDDYAVDQQHVGSRIYSEYLKPHVLDESITTVLDVGCGIGGTVSAFLADGYDAYGVDLPDLSRHWARLGRSRERFLCCAATKLPFRDDSFDLTISLGVIEHIGTTTGHAHLRDDYREARQQFVDELVRVTRPGGRILLASPNKCFPVDVQHGVPPEDSATPSQRLRAYIFRRTGANIHKTWGRYHLPSYSECTRLFRHAGVDEIRALPLRGYLGFSRFKTGSLKRFAGLASAYVNCLPPVLRATALNPYLLMEGRK